MRDEEISYNKIRIAELESELQKAQQKNIKQEKYFHERIQQVYVLTVHAV